MKKILNLKTGFTLVETLVALAIFIIAVLVVIQVFPVGLKSTIRSRDETMAINLLQSKIEDVTNQTYDDVINVSETRFSTDQADPYYKFQYQISVQYIKGDLTDSGTDLGLKKVTVFVFWPEFGQEKTLAGNYIKKK